MTYFTAGTVKRRLECAFLQWSSGGSVNTACPLTLLNHNWSSSPVINGTGDGLVLPAGSYMASAYVYATRTTATQNVLFQFFLGGSAIGMSGNSDVYQNGANVDQADAEFTLTSSNTLELKITVVESSIPTLLPYCRIVLWRVKT